MQFVPQTPVEYFKELVERAIERQKLASSEYSSYYLVQLLSGFIRHDRMYSGAPADENQSLAELLCHALSSDGVRSLKLFKHTGDLALFVSGFFGDSVARQRVGLDYYVRVGGAAYSHAACLSPHDAAPVFRELSAKFSRFVDVLNEVSEENSLCDAAGLLKLYERWLATGSRRSATLLKENGVLLSPGSEQVH